ncbi:hypothetical protein J6590_066071 [Homalodisca vitripennis]|nr:hypothetical protein J6590_066071 [Homalodisca vitripennis]
MTVGDGGVFSLTSEVLVNLNKDCPNSSSWISIGGGSYSLTLPILNILSLRKQRKAGLGGEIRASLSIGLFGYHDRKENGSRQEYGHNTEFVDPCPLHEEQIMLLLQEICCPIINCIPEHQQGDSLLLHYPDARYKASTLALPSAVLIRPAAGRNYGDLLKNI